MDNVPIEQPRQAVSMTPRLVDELHQQPAQFVNCFPIFLMPMGFARMMCCELTPNSKVLTRGSFLVSTADLINLKNNIENVLNNTPKMQEPPTVEAPTEQPSVADQFIENMKRQASKGN